MGIFPFSLPFSLVVDFYAIPKGLDITDVEYLQVDGIDTQSVINHRNIKCAIDKSGARRLESIFGGSVSDGDIAVLTKEKMYIADAYASGQRQLQTFFDMAGYSYRVIGVDPWKRQIKTRVYLCRRHVKQEIV